MRYLMTNDKMSPEEHLKQSVEILKHFDALGKNSAGSYQEHVERIKAIQYLHTRLVQLKQLETPVEQAPARETQVESQNEK